MEEAESLIHQRIWTEGVKVRSCGRKSMREGKVCCCWVKFITSGDIEAGVGCTYGINKE